ncbi:MAG: hypothetical protein OEX16_04555, partial [Hadesarchaea archaeon]|nr:hypothetical protein [Hadesarchaea archaeon]
MLLLCFLLLASIQQSPVTASNSENIPDDSQENLSPSSESELDEASITVFNPSADDNSEPADNVTPPTESELNGPDITRIDPPFSENSESMGQNVTPFDDNFMIENGPDLTRCSLPSPDPTDDDPWVGVKVRNNDDDQHKVYIYVDGVNKGYLNVDSGCTAYSDLIYVPLLDVRCKVEIRWYDHDDQDEHYKELTQWVTWLTVFSFELQYIPPRPHVGYAYAQIYNADDDQHYVYVYLDGEPKGYVKVPSKTTRYTSYYEVLEGYHTMKIKWYDEDDAKWHEKSLLHYVSRDEYQKYYFSLPPPPIGYAYAQIYNADDDQHDVYVYLDGAYKECVKVPSKTTRYTSYYTVYVGYHTMKIEWYDEDD